MVEQLGFGFVLGIGVMIIFLMYVEIMREDFVTIYNKRCMFECRYRDIWVYEVCFFGLACRGIWVYTRK